MTPDSRTGASDDCQAGEPLATFRLPSVSDSSSLVLCCRSTDSASGSCDSACPVVLVGIDS